MIKFLIVVLSFNSFAYARVSGKMIGEWEGTRYKHVAQADGSIEDIIEPVEGQITQDYVLLNYVSPDGEEYFIKDTMTVVNRVLGSFNFERNYKDLYFGNGEGYCHLAHCSFSIIGTNHAAGAADYFQTLTMTDENIIEIRGYRYANKKILYHWEATLTRK